MSKHCCLQSISSSKKRPWIEEVRFFAPPIIIFTLILHNRFVTQFGLNPPIGLSGITIFFYVVGKLADIYSTQLCMQFKDPFEQKGYDFPIRETNWLLPDQPTLKQHLFSLSSLFSLLGIFYVYYVPAVGMGASLLFLSASWANLQMRNWLVQNLRQLDETGMAQ